MIYIIGMNHKDNKHKEKMKEYVLKASRQELIVILEGFSAEPDTFNEIRLFFKINNGEGYVFGCEPPKIIKCFIDLLLHFSYCYYADLKDDAIMGNLRVIYDIITLEEMRNIWRTLNTDSKLYRRINEIIQGKIENGLDIEGIVNFFYHNRKDILTDPEWILLYRLLIPSLKNQLPQQFRELLDDERIKVYLSDNLSPQERQDLEAYIVFEVSINLRDKFIANNISQIIDSSRHLNKDFYVFIGAGHLENLIPALQQNFGNEIEVINDPTTLP